MGGIEHGEMSPFDYHRPLIVALTNRRATRLLRDYLRQNDVFIRLREAEALGIKQRYVVSECIAEIAVVSFEQVSRITRGHEVSLDGV